MRLWLLIMAVCAMAAAAAITEEKLRSAQGDSGAWLMDGRNYSAWRSSELSQINTGNVSKLAPRWVFHTAAGPLENTPLVFDGLVLATGPAHLGKAADLAAGMR